MRKDRRIRSTAGRSADIGGRRRPSDAGARESDTLWYINYRPNGDVASVVSPVPAAAEDGSGVARDSVVYAFATDPGGVLMTSIFDGTLPDPSDPSDVVAETLLEGLRHATDWTPVP